MTSIYYSQFYYPNLKGFPFWWQCSALVSVDQYQIQIYVRQVSSVSRLRPRRLILFNFIFWTSYSLYILSNAKLHENPCSYHLLLSFAWLFNKRERKVILPHKKREGMIIPSQFLRRGMVIRSQFLKTVETRAWNESLAHIWNVLFGLCQWRVGFVLQPFFHMAKSIRCWEWLFGGVYLRQKSYNSQFLP